MWSFESVILLLIIVGALYIFSVRVALRRRPARKRRLGTVTAVVVWFVWVALMALYVDAVAEYTGTKLDWAVLLAVVGTLALWGSAPWLAVKLASDAERVDHGT